mgnify:CR=1 FL=1
MIILPISANGYFYNRRIHKEQVHQYIVQEAYRYFAKHVGSIPALKNYAGLDTMGNPFFGAGQIYYMAI